MRDDYTKLLRNGQADMVFTDPPYNVPIDGHFSGLGAVRHREFAFASGEMSETEFIGFLTATLTQAAHVMKHAAIAFPASKGKPPNLTQPAAETTYCSAQSAPPRD